MKTNPRESRPAEKAERERASEITDASSDHGEHVRQNALTLEYVTSQIISLGERFREDVGVTPFDVCLGPAEFQLIFEENAKRDLVAAPEWHYKARNLWYSGMRLRLMNSPGILVGVLESRGRRGPSVGRGTDEHLAAPLSPKSASPTEAEATPKI